MYLSRIELDLGRRETIKALSSPQVMHSAVYGCFEDTREGENRILWRVDKIFDKTFLLVQSPEKPDFKVFAKQYSNEAGDTKPYDAWLAHIENDRVFGFRLCANPVHSAKNSDGGRGKVYAHVTSGQQKQWLGDRAEKLGFSIGENDFNVIYSEKLKFKRKDQFVCLGTATYEGVLKVTDNEVLKAAMIQGIGRGKAYGCGLLTLVQTR